MKLPGITWLRRLHRWIALAIMLPLLLEGVSGTILVAAHMIDSWRAPVLSQPAALHSNPVPILAAASRQGPEGLRPSRYVAAAGLRPAVVDFVRPGARQASLRVWVDPASLAVLARVRDPGAAMAIVRQLHESLLLPMNPGRSLIGWFGMGLVLLVVTGVPIWLPPRGRRLSGFRVARTARGARLMRELHGAIAIWLMLPLFFQAFSGVTLAFPVTTRSLLGLPQIQRGMPHGARANAQDDGAPDLAAILSRLEAALPGTGLAELRLPSDGRGLVMARMRRSGAAFDAPLAVAMVMPDGSRIVSLDDPSRRPASAFLGWLRALHTATFGGPVWNAVQILAGLALPLLAITGGTLWLLRRIRRSRQRARAGPRIADAIPPLSLCEDAP